MNYTDEAISLLDSDTLPFSFYGNSVFSFATGNEDAMRVSLKISSVNLGVLSEDDYQPVANRTKRSILLIRKALVFVKSLIQRLDEGGKTLSWVSIKCSSSFLVKTDPVKEIYDIFGEGSDLISRIVLEFHCSLLDELDEAMMQSLNKLSNSGIKTLLRDFGDTFCPTMLLASCPFTFVELHPSVVALMHSKEENPAAPLLLSFIHGLGVKTLVPDLELNREREIGTYNAHKCYGYTIKHGEQELLEAIS